MLHAMPQHHLVEDLTALESDQRVIHLRLLSAQRLHIVVLPVEGGRGSGSGLCLCGGGGALGPLCITDRLRARHLGSSVRRLSLSGDLGGETSGGPQSGNGLCARLLHCYACLYRREERRGERRRKPRKGKLGCRVGLEGNGNWKSQAHMVVELKSLESVSHAETRTESGASLAAV